MHYTSQLNKDIILNVHPRHPITCPLINPLQFKGEYASKIYEVKIDFDPSGLVIKPQKLFTGMNGLQKWASGVLSIYSKLPKMLQNIDVHIEDYTKLLNSHRKDEIKQQSMDINSIIEDWKQHRAYYIKAVEEVNTIEQSLNMINKVILLEKLSNKESSQTQLTLNKLQQKLIEPQQIIKKEKLYFAQNIYNQFNEKTDHFSSFLEDVRDRNDEVRWLTDLIRRHIFQYAKDILKLYQPDEYLDIKFGVNDANNQNKNYLNLGVLFNNSKISKKTESSRFIELVRGLKANKHLDYSQTEIIFSQLSKPREELKSVLFLMLSINGYKKVRYYEEHTDFITNKNVFKEESIVQKNKAKNTAKIN